MIGKPVAHANADANIDTDAHATTGDDARTRLQAAERLGKAAARAAQPHDERTAPAALPAPIHRPVLPIQPYSLFCILLLGELPTDFPDRSVGES
ncbi:hypothetical protein [Burkholderia contaminans]|uniref:hypothetical protein n=1 Tax=Burkholderia contaminans TaxID=488447 RepID=UPI00158386AF|nr:hypothetical protein [Burkholderia contaminans]